MNEGKTAAFDEMKPVTIELNGQPIDAAHHFTTPDNRLLHLYINCREGGIDVTVPLCSDKPPYAWSDVGLRVLGMDEGTNGDEEPRLVTDGGFAPPVHGVCERVGFNDVEVGEPVMQRADRVAGHVVKVEDDRVLIAADMDGMAWYVKKFAHGYDSDAEAWVWHREGPARSTPAGDLYRGPGFDGVFRCAHCGAVTLHHENHPTCARDARNGGDG